MNKVAVVAAAALMAFAFGEMAPAQAQERNIVGQQRYQVGTLTCRLAPSIGLIIGSRQRMECQFRKGQGKRERYFGTVTRLGLDLGFTAGGVMTWLVLARTRTIGRGLLIGNFAGASGDISLGLGVGANVLIGGSRRSVMLQPLSLSGQVGVNLALGIAGLTLRTRR